ncbi:MAG: hypothetical protein DBX39_00880 [Bacillota bacterium]|nr:MAG: hypothetical protein DBX39_00880 [Bacillota bacterium]
MFSSSSDKEEAARKSVCVPPLLFLYCSFYITGFILWVVYCGLCIKGKASPRNFSGRRLLFIGIFPLCSQIYLRVI